MLLEPCCCTFAPVKPWPFTRLFKIAIDCDICELVGVVLWGATALIVIVVPLDRSRPRPTLNLLCQLPGCTRALPMIVPSKTISRAARTARYRHGLDVTPGCRDAAARDDDLLLGDATYARPFAGRARHAVRRCGRRGHAYLGD